MYCGTRALRSPSKLGAQTLVLPCTDLCTRSRGRALNARSKQAGSAGARSNYGARRGRRPRHQPSDSSSESSPSSSQHPPAAPTAGPDASTAAGGQHHNADHLDLRILGGEAGSGWLLNPPASDMPMPASATHYRQRMPRTQPSQPQGATEEQHALKSGPDVIDSQHACTSIVVSPPAPLVAGPPGDTHHTLMHWKPSNLDEGLSEDQRMSLHTKAPLVVLAANTHSALSIAEAEERRIILASDLNDSTGTVNNTVQLDALSDRDPAADTQGLQEMHQAFPASEQLLKQPQHEQQTQQQQNLWKYDTQREADWRQQLQQLRGEQEGMSATLTSAPLALGSDAQGPSPALHIVDSSLNGSSGSSSTALPSNLNWRQQAEAALDESNSSHSDVEPTADDDDSFEKQQAYASYTPGRGKVLTASKGYVQQSFAESPSTMPNALASISLQAPAFFTQQHMGHESKQQPAVGIVHDVANDADAPQSPLSRMLDGNGLMLATEQAVTLKPTFVTPEPVTQSASAPAQIILAAPVAAPMDQQADTTSLTAAKLEPSVVMVSRMASNVFTHAAAAVVETTPKAAAVVVQSGRTGAKVATNLVGQGVNIMGHGVDLMGQGVDLVGHGIGAASKVVGKGVDIAAEATRVVLGATASTAIAAAGLTACIGVTTVSVVGATAGMVADTTKDVVNIVGHAGLVAVHASGSALGAVADGVGDLVSAEDRTTVRLESGTYHATPVLQAVSEQIIGEPAAASSSAVEVAKLQVEVAAVGVVAAGATAAAAAADSRPVPNANGEDWGEQETDWSTSADAEKLSLQNAVASHVQEDESWVGAVAGAAAGALIGCALGPVAGPVGASVGAAVGAAVGGAVLKMGEAQSDTDRDQGTFDGEDRTSAITPLGAVLGMVVGAVSSPGGSAAFFGMLVGAAVGGSLGASSPYLTEPLLLPQKKVDSKK